jgi:hypothetical protein
MQVPKTQTSPDVQAAPSSQVKLLRAVCLQVPTKGFTGLKQSSAVQLLRSSHCVSFVQGTPTLPCKRGVLASDSSVLPTAMTASTFQTALPE